MPLLQSLIDKFDTTELVRDAIAQVLVAELANQQALALLASKDPIDWTMDVYVERDFPIGKWLDVPSPMPPAIAVPSVTVSIENSSVDPSSSSAPGAQQKYGVTYLVDVLAVGVNLQVGGGGHEGADFRARVGCHAAMRLVRNILVATPNRFLGLESLKLIWGHPHFTNFEYGQAPVEDTQASFSTWNGRGRFVVDMTELAPEYVGEAMELIRIDVSDDGGVIISTEITP